MLKRTPLFALHQAAHALMVDFAGWSMPLHYGSQISEHHSVRQKVGMFDVSHMGIVDIKAKDATRFLRRLLANDVAKLNQDGKALYTCMLNVSGGVVDDLIVYRLATSHYRIVCNAACFSKDLAWMQAQLQSDTVHIEPQPQLAIIALQGPEALQRLKLSLPTDESKEIEQLRPFSAYQNKDGILYARTGYTGEDGIECILPNSDAIRLWQTLSQQGVQPCGLAARDTLRLEAGLNLYGQDMTEVTTPLESNLAWTICWRDLQREFIGKKALDLQKQQGNKQRLVGLLLENQGVLRTGQRVVTANGEGKITSGSFSPTLGKAIALARIPQAAENHVQVERRGQLLSAIIVQPPFVRFGKSVYHEEKK